MSEQLSPVQRARKNESVILQALAAMGQQELARSMAVSESTVSRLKDGQFSTLAVAMAHMGLKVVPVGSACFDPAYVEALKTLAQAGLKQQAPTLNWEEA